MYKVWSAWQTSVHLVPIIKIILFFFNVEQKKKAKSAPRTPAVVLWPWRLLVLLGGWDPAKKESKKKQNGYEMG